jgi:hypothetical protein
MRFPISIVLLVSLANCDDGTVARNNPVPQAPVPPAPAELEANGTYLLSSRVEVPPTVLASQTIVDYLALLRQLKTNPATAFFTLLDQAGVPMASELLGALPSVVKDRLAGAINDFVGGQTGGAAGAEIERILALSETAFARFILESQLDVPAGAEVAPMVGAHAIAGLTLELPGGIPVTVPESAISALAPLPGALAASPTVAIKAVEPGAGGDATIVVGDHFFGLAYGEVIFAVLDGYGTGVSLRSRLAGAFDCHGMGTWVANRCVLGMCIGHAGDVTGLCESALDLAVEQVHDQLSGLSFEAVHFAEGHGRLWDQASSEARDGLVSRVDQGVWQASIDVSTGPRDSKATFTGRR